MFPGITTRLSEESISLTTTITPKSDIVRVTSTASTTVVANIVPPYAGFSGMFIFLNLSGAAITTVTSGNINSAITIVANQVATVFVFSKISNKWFPGALA